MLQGEEIKTLMFADDNCDISGVTRRRETHNKWHERNPGDSTT